MLRLTYHQTTDEAPESYRFPVEIARLLRRNTGLPRARVDRGASDAARTVERAMRQVELRFERLRDLMLEPTEPDPDRPRAA